ncbi:YwqG family protein [Pyxidicoccus sp. 3LG]
MLEQARAPCILFDKVVGAPSPRGCRYGGLPFLPPGTSWPRSPEGPLHFLGQLDFAELAECRGEHLPELPKEGLLAFFYDVENQPWGTKPSHRAFWELIHVPPGSEQVPLSPPAELLRAERPVLPLRHLRPSLGLSLPGWADLNAPVEPDFWSEEQGEDIIELRRALAGTDNPDQGADQLRGHPNWWQEDGRIDAQLASNGIDAYRSDLSPQEERLKSGASEWTLLWQVGTDEELDLVWGSQGTLYLLIRNKDLRARRFDRAWLILQCS